VGQDFTDASKSNIVVEDLATHRRRTVLEGASFARYGGGRLLFVRGARAYSVPFDLERLAVSGTAKPVFDDVTTNPLNGLAHFEVAGDGTVVYASGPPIVDPVHVVVRRDARGEESILRLPPGNYYSPRLSPDGKRLALLQFDASRGTVVIFDRERGVSSKLTTEPGRFLAPVWSPDGGRLAFARVLDRRPELCLKNADGSGAIQTMPRATGDDAEFPSSWSPDGRAILITVTYSSNRTPERRQLSSDVWVAPLDAKEKPRPWLESPFRETAATVSPDGRWVAFVSDESGAPQVYVRPFAGSGAKMQISTDGGAEPGWIRDGRELVYRTGEGKRTFVAVEVLTDRGLSVSSPKTLFTTDWLSGTLNHEFREWDASRDGGEMIGIRRVARDEPDRRIELVMNGS
jgi:serine/threonine-protein kinase